MAPKKAVAPVPKPTTRSATAPQPPVVVPVEKKRKRRTAEEIQMAKDAKEAAKVEQQRQHKEKLKRIAAMENRLAAEDAKALGKSASRPRPRPLQRTYAVADLSADPSASETESINIDVVFPGEDTDQGGLTDTEAGGEPDTDVETPKKKQKISVRESINKHAAQLAAVGTRTSNEKRTDKNRDNASSASAKVNQSQARASGRNGPVT